MLDGLNRGVPSDRCRGLVAAFRTRDGGSREMEVSGEEGKASNPQSLIANSANRAKW